MSVNIIFRIAAVGILVTILVQVLKHSYFCNTKECTDEWMQDVVDFDILPMLAEYWFDDTDKLQRWENILHGIFQ